MSVVCILYTVLCNMGNVALNMVHYSFCIEYGSLCICVFCFIFNICIDDNIVYLYR